MLEIEVENPIINSPCEEPVSHWKIHKHEPPEKPERHPIYALPGKENYAISFPRVEGYRQAITSRLICDMERIPPLSMDTEKIPPEVEMKAALQNNQGRPSL